MSSKLDKIKERVAAATPGPWDDDGDFGVASLADARFIAHSREDISLLLKVVEAAREYCSLPHHDYSVAEWINLLGAIDQLDAEEA